MPPRILAVAALALLGALAAVSPSLAQDADGLRRELEQMREQFDAMKQQYERAMEALGERIRRLEAPPAAATPPPAPVPSATAAPAPTTPGVADLLRPREPFALSTRRGPGQFLFDMGVAADFVGNLVTQDRIARANAGSFEGLENRFFPREIELSLFGQIDPHARGEVRLEAAEEFEDGSREIHVGLAEAHLTLLTLPWSTQVKAGYMRNRFGLLNERHLHDRPQIDVPNVLVRFLGDEGLVESGVEATWVPDLPIYVEALVGVFNGDNDEAFGRGSLKHPLFTGRLRTFLDLERHGALQLGVSGATGETDDSLRQTLLGVDARYKLTPEGRRHPLLTMGAEALWSWRRVEDAGTGADETRKAAGWYVYGEVQPWRRWAAGVRYDRTQYLEDPGHEWAVGPYLSFSPSDFLRFRVGYKHTERSRNAAFYPPDISTGTVDEFMLQATFFLGAHPAHPF